MAFISRQGIGSTFSADAHLLSPNNGWAVDVFFILFASVASYTKFLFLSTCFLCFFVNYITPYMALLIDYPSPIAYNGTIHITKGDNNNEL